MQTSQRAAKAGRQSTTLCNKTLVKIVAFIKAVTLTGQPPSLIRTYTHHAAK